MLRIVIVERKGRIGKGLEKANQFLDVISSLDKGYIHGNIPVKFSTVLENSCVCRKIFGYD